MCRETPGCEGLGKAECLTVECQMISHLPFINPDSSDQPKHKARQVEAQSLRDTGGASELGVERGQRTQVIAREASWIPFPLTRESHIPAPCTYL